MRDIRKLTQQIVRSHKTCNPFDICQDLNITVFFRSLGSVRGVFQKNSRKKIIHINSELHEAVMRQICAHELGHALLHDHNNAFFLDGYTFANLNKYEREANIFASELLINDLPKVGYTIEDIAKIYRVEEELVEYKLNLL